MYLCAQEQGVHTQINKHTNTCLTKYLSEEICQWRKRAKRERARKVKGGPQKPVGGGEGACTTAIPDYYHELSQSRKWCNRAALRKSQHLEGKLRTPSRAQRILKPLSTPKATSTRNTLEILQAFYNNRFKPRLSRFGGRRLCNHVTDTEDERVEARCTISASAKVKGFLRDPVGIL